MARLFSLLLMVGIIFGSANYAMDRVLPELGINPAGTTSAQRMISSAQQLRQQVNQANAVRRDRVQYIDQMIQQQLEPGALND